MGSEFWRSSWEWSGGRPRPPDGRDARLSIRHRIYCTGCMELSMLAFGILKCSERCAPIEVTLLVHAVW